MISIDNFPTHFSESVSAFISKQLSSNFQQIKFLEMSNISRRILKYYVNFNIRITLKLKNLEIRFSHFFCFYGNPVTTLGRARFSKSPPIVLFFFFSFFQIPKRTS